MTAWVLAGARSQPAVLAFEDLHWADPTSLDLMRALAERGAQAPLFVVATTRPEFRPPWSVRSHHSVISLAPLDRAQVARMVGELASRHALSKDVIEGVNERTGGVPLFVEEVTRLLLERGVEGGAQAIPPTLQQSLAARLDRLGPAREIAQIGAVLGRGFSHALLQAVAGLEEAGLQSALDRLAEADILFVEGDGAQANYRFKHALIQDAAYESLLKSRRQALHRRAAEILRESASPEGGWMAADDGALADGIERMRRGAENLRGQNALVFDGLIKIALAEAEAGVGDPDRAVAILDEALATVDHTGYRAFEAELQRVRGEILLECDPANPAPAEEAFRRLSPSRSGKARAVLNCARRFRWPSSTNRPAVPSTPTLSRAGAGRLFADAGNANAGDRRGAGAASGLTQVDEVKAQASRRQRLTQIGIGLGQG